MNVSGKNTSRPRSPTDRIALQLPNRSETTRLVGALLRIRHLAEQFSAALVDAGCCPDQHFGFHASDDAVLHQESVDEIALEPPDTTGSASGSNLR